MPRLPWSTFVVKALVTILLIAACFSMPACTGGSGTSDDYFAPGYNITPPEIVATPNSRGELTPMDSYAFGEVSSTASTLITLNNVGDLAAAITNISFGNSAFTFAGGTFPGTAGSCTQSIPANGSCTVAVSFTPTPGASISATLSVVYRSRDGEKTLSVLFTGSGPAQSGNGGSGTTTYAPPMITSIDIAAGAIAGGTAIKLIGTGFRSGATVDVGGTPCATVSIDAATMISCTTPAHSAGTVDIVVTNSDTQTGTLSNGFTFQAAPTVTAVSANAGALAGGTTVTVTGSGFLSGATVDFGGSACGAVSVGSATQLTCTTSTHAAGSVVVTVTNSDFQFGSSAGAYTYRAAPTVTSISPNAGALAGSTAVTITGTGFVSGASVSLGGSSCTGVSVLNATTATCTTSAHAAGAVDVVVTNADNQAGMKSSGFTYQAAPTISTVLPAIGDLAGSTAVTITGTGFVTGATVSFGGSNCGSVNVNSATELTCTTSAHAAGAVTVTVTNTDTQSGNRATAFTYLTAPTVDSVSPTVGGVAGGTMLMISGTGFVNGATVMVDNQACTGVWFGSAVSLMCFTPAHSAGIANVVVTNPDSGVGTLVNGFTYRPAPTVSSVSPNSAELNSTTPVTITGTNFFAGANVYFGGTLCTSISVASSTEITCTVSPSDGGAQDVIVYNSEGQSATLANGFTHTGGGSWTSTSNTNPPAVRSRQATVWTGSKMIVWGGSGAGYLNTGGIYDAVSDSWSATTTTNAPQARIMAPGVWTGAKMVVWGGQISGGVPLSTGGVYDLLTDTWTATTSTNAPAARYYHKAVWSGSKMIIWGGTAGGNDKKNTGATYDPQANTWTATTTVGAPAGRLGHVFVWTGSEMFIWGGVTATAYATDGGKYNPNTNTWASITSTNAPSGRWETSAIWTGSKMIVWGGQNGSTMYNTGGVYDAANDSWTATTMTNALSARANHSMIWTGSRMIVWGGVVSSGFDDGRLYDPNTDTWTRTTKAGAPSARAHHSAVWTGSKMIVWGPDTTGGVYTPPSDPASNTWTATSTVGNPMNLLQSTAIWTGSKMIVWGGAGLRLG